jgi:hypothetical protein
MPSHLLQFGEHVDGYTVPVVNERAVRAAAGLLFFPALVSFMHAFLLGNFQPTRLFVLLFVADMALRMLQPRWSPSLIVGGWIVRHQTPEWTGAAQKRFAWGLGLLLGLVMVYLMVLNNIIGPINMLICGACLLLMFFETAFGICLGCKLHNVFVKQQAQHCPGGVCDVPGRSTGRLQSAQVAVLVVFVAGAVWAGQWVQHTGPTGATHHMATQEGAAASGKDCTVPAFAKAIGHEEMWKLHNGC